jgi:hypothetical protein
MQIKLWIRLYNSNKIKKPIIQLYKFTVQINFIYLIVFLFW